MILRLALVAAIAATAAVALEYVPSPVPTPVPAPPPTTQRNAALDFRVDELFKYREVLCTPAERRCLRSGLIHYEPDGKCYSVASKGPCPEGSLFFMDKEQMLNDTGRIRGACAKEGVCPDPLMTPLAHDGSCRSLKELIDICDPVRNIFGETECECNNGWACSGQRGTPSRLDKGKCMIQRLPQLENPQLRRFRGGDEGNYTGRRFPCSEAEKECLRNGQLLHEADESCYLAGERGPCSQGQTFLVDKQEALEGSGRFRGRCVNASSCPEEGYERMAYDGSCRRKYEASFICSKNGQSETVSIFGETVCECAECPREPFDDIQPDEEGSCVFPDIRQAKLPYLVPSRELPNVLCTDTELLCFYKNRIYYEKNDTCEELRSTELCPEDQWLVADREEALNGSGRLVAGCRPRPCPPGEVLMLYDGRCHAEVEVTRKVCSGRPIVFDAFGGAACGDGNEPSEQLPKYSLGRGFCSFFPFFSARPPYPAGGTIGHLGSAVCSESDSGSCPLEVVFSGDSDDLD